ncbi:hypothetical protein [Haliangium ochraceum]|uniref:Dihydrolipoamide acetyltransferase n=1 Tax=Haliangium ochraceum (strain DSM 14365 / JCM 11303 / SMP-2) TaxID=502025 RepID=D0LQF3_HALO1|nr:hypothetical protein [Haliangium ochraceum]ACY18962.1 conserved hypothetical protein [Haliangium ochraceum DSM 14365]
MRTHAALRATRPPRFAALAVGAALSLLVAALSAGPSWAQSGPAAAQSASAAPASAPSTAPAPQNPAPAPAQNSALGGDGDAVPDNLRLRSLEQRVQALKERAWRVKARVSMLEESVLGAGAGANATIVHVDDMGSSYKLVQLVYNLDGTQVFARKAESGALSSDELEILSGPLSPGSHTVSVTAVYQGRGYGVFKYMNKYKFTVRSSRSFTANEGKNTRIEAVAFERGNVTTPLQQRPAIDFKISYGADAAPRTAE